MIKLLRSAIAEKFLFWSWSIMPESKEKDLIGEFVLKYVNTIIDDLNNK